MATATGLRRVHWRWQFMTKCSHCYLHRPRSQDGSNNNEINNGNKRAYAKLTSEESERRERLIFLGYKGRAYEHAMASRSNLIGCLSALSSLSLPQRMLATSKSCTLSLIGISASVFCGRHSNKIAIDKDQR